MSRNRFGELLRKYDRPVPRYTSYPTVPSWTGISADDWRASVEMCLRDFGKGTSVYVHVPYCRSLCAFCACTREISRNYGLAAPFVDAILRELDLKLEGRALLLRDLHLGGGTPTWLPPQELERLIVGIKASFQLPDSSDGATEISIEVDPRSFLPAHAEVLARTGVTRVSLGIQDFNEATLHAIKRFQSLDQVETVITQLREHGITALNFDLVYGLPYQSETTMKATGETLARLRPSRIALYSYAHLPSLKPAQKGVERHGLPEGEAKWALYESLRSVLIGLGYIEIGMDHFALPDDSLVQALKHGDLHRNFMGYTVRRSSLLLGLGPSSLSDAWYAFAQNEKEIEPWLEQVSSRAITAPRGGHLLNKDDLMRRQQILDLMCRQQTQMTDSAWEEISTTEAVVDCLIERDANSGIAQVSAEGRPFLRTICALFDTHLTLKPHSRFSRAI